MTIDLSKEINPVYQPFFYNEKRFLVLYGGAGSGKSVFATQKIITRCLMNSGERFLVCRKVARTIKRSVFQLFKDILSLWGLLKKCKVNNTDFSIEIPCDDGNTSSIMFAGMDDPEKIKSIAGVTGIWLEEATEFDEKDVDQLNLRLRGESPSYKQIMLTFNPVSERNFLKAKFFDQINPRVSTLKTTYRDNEFLDDDYITELEDEIMGDENLRRIYVDGEWGIVKTGEEFFHTFKRSIHVGSYTQSDSPAIFAIDYNNRPYMTCVQLEKRRGMLENGNTINAYVVVREFCKKPPNDVESLIQEVIDETGVRRCYWIDDPSGKNENSKKNKKELKSLTAQVKKTFEENKVMATKIVLRSAPPLRKRKRAWMKLLNAKDQWHFRVDKNCKNTIYDFESLQEDTSGAWVKKKVRDKEKGVVFEEAGHIADALTYYFTTEFNQNFKSGGSFGF